MAEPPESIMEERETMLISPKGKNPVQKNAHFIKPILGLAQTIPEKPSISLPFRPISQKVTFHGWRNPNQQWISWVDRLHSSYQYIWKRAGIYEAILCSRYKIIKNEDLFFGLAERWCSETNTFVFPWGEASVTLEDVMILGGYSVLGDSVSGSAGDKEFAEIERKLVNAHVEMSRGKSQKANQSLWMKHFMKDGDGIEHEAFLSLWLSRFVLPTYPFDTIVKRFFKIAIYLARGIKIALAPVVLASIYRDLSLLKSVMDSGNQVKDVDKGDDFDALFMVTLWAPLQFVQVWAWERFPEFRPKPSAIEYGEPRLARWHNVSETEIGNVRPMLQSAGHTFQWRPYCKRVDNLPFPAFYSDNEEFVLVNSGLGEDTQSFVRFLRVCQLVGMDSVEKYNPHRVAMQFGFDQDVPDHVGGWLRDPEIPKREVMQLAWLSYTKPIMDLVLFVPSKDYEPKVTMRYLKWHRDGVLTRLATFEGVLRRRRSSKRSHKLREIKKENVFVDNEADVPPGFLPKIVGEDLDVPPGFLPKIVGEDLDVPPGFLPKIVGEDLDVPPGFLPKIVGEDLDVPLGFLPKIVGQNLDVPPGFLPKVLEHPRGSSVCPFKENVLSPYSNPCEIRSNADRNSVKSEPRMWEFEGGGSEGSNGEITQNMVHDNEEQSKHRMFCKSALELDIEDRISRLEKVVAALEEAKSARVFNPS